MLELRGISQYDGSQELRKISQENFNAVSEYIQKLEKKIERLSKKGSTSQQFEINKERKTTTKKAVNAKYIRLGKANRDTVKPNSLFIDEKTGMPTLRFDNGEIKEISLI